MANKNPSTATTTPRAPGKAAATERRAKAAALQAAARRREQRRKVAIRAGTGAGALAVVGGVVALALTSQSTPASKGALPTVAAADGAGLPPWPVPADPTAGIRAAGLEASNMEGTAAHFHPHLDLFVDGRAVPVAADIGVGAQAMSELHTHDASGVVHIESPTADKRYVLGQLFTEWGVRLDATHLGGLAASGGKTLRAYVDGEPVSGDPARIELLAHREIALVYGAPDQKVDVPSSYDFAAGE